MENSDSMMDDYVTYIKVGEYVLKCLDYRLDRYFDAKHLRDQISSKNINVYFKRLSKVVNKTFIPFEEYPNFLIWLKADVIDKSFYFKLIELMSRKGVSKDELLKEVAQKEDAEEPLIEELTPKTDFALYRGDKEFEYILLIRDNIKYYKLKHPVIFEAKRVELSKAKALKQKLKETLESFNNYIYSDNE